MTAALATATPAVEAALFNPDEHLNGVLDILERVLANGSAYPPAAAGTTRRGLASWLLEAPAHDRWVALADGAVAGHIMTMAPGPALTAALSDLGHATRAAEGILEVGRFFTDPAARGLGLGAALFEAACAAAEETGYQPALTVPDASREARRFFIGRGLQELGSVVGVHGRTRILVRDPAGIRAARFEAMRQGLYNLLS